ncbi:MAG: FGGY family carbohydrate kinase [Christensenellaceae bacterium]|nr:FGGY family carbohydrate kinase [Christensenellaceae bacterium]MEA5066629.1 FGGY family carbohydrate kinase [Eubacteriales bacterium]MEA5069233.1 FGGY family carbohydrate kinase [Christensenellaceae bacterium]
MNVIGLDIGTTSLSAVVVEDGGRTLAARSVDSDSAIPGRPWEHLQDPVVIVARALELVKQLANEYGPIASIGLTGQMHGILYLDAEGKACSPLYTWQDARCELKPGGGSDETYAARLSRLTGHRMATGFGAATHDWHVLHGCVPEGAVRFCAIHDYVGMVMTGRKTPLTHISDAASFGLFDAASGAFDAAAIARAGLDMSFFPEVARGAELLGFTHGGIPVSVAIGDNQAGFLGAVQGDEAVMVSVGTSGQTSLTSNATALPDCLDARPLNLGDRILVGSTLCGGRAYAQLEAFFRSCAALAGIAPARLYPAMNALAPGALDLPDKLVVDTRFAGARHCPDARGSIAGITTGNLTPQHLIGGVLEGIAAELHEMYRAMLRAGAQPRSVLIGAGNAVRNNPALVAALERAFGLPLKMPVHREEAAYGAALFGMAAAGGRTLAQARALIAYQ